MTEAPFARITVAVDGSKYSDRALEVAISLAKKYDSELSVISVAPVEMVYVSAAQPWVPTEVPGGETPRFRDLVEAAVKKAHEAGVVSVAGVCLEGVITDEIIGHLEQMPTDLLVIGSRGSSAAKRLFLGSVSDALIHHVQCAVLVVRLKP
ncbi:MAG TPA: universal stress protein [Thermoplasmata archaeon]|nr:universal stress protein [Thermoplasmata archaeon]